MQKISAEQMRAIGEICRTFSRRLDKGAKPGVVVAELIKTFPDPSATQKNILKELRRSVRKADESQSPKAIYEEIVSVLCNWGDTTEEDEVLDSLKAITPEVGDEG